MTEKFSTNLLFGDSALLTVALKPVSCDAALISWRKLSVKWRETHHPCGCWLSCTSSSSASDLQQRWIFTKHSYESLNTKQPRALNHQTQIKAAHTYVIVKAEVIILRVHYQFFHCEALFPFRICVINGRLPQVHWQMSDISAIAVEKAKQINTPASMNIVLHTTSLLAISIRDKIGSRSMFLLTLQGNSVQQWQSSRARWENHHRRSHHVDQK